MQELLTSDLCVQAQVFVLHVGVHYLQFSLCSVTKQFSRHVMSHQGLSSNDTYQGNEADLVELSQTMVRDDHSRQDVG